MSYYDRSAGLVLFDPSGLKKQADVDPQKSVQNDIVLSAIVFAVLLYYFYSVRRKTFLASIIIAGLINAFLVFFFVDRRYYTSPTVVTATWIYSLIIVLYAFSTALNDNRDAVPIRDDFY